MKQPVQQSQQMNTEHLAAMMRTQPMSHKFLNNNSHQNQFYPSASFYSDSEKNYDEDGDV
jgi:hypothetical protein